MKNNEILELNDADIEQVSGGRSNVDWNAISAGATMFGASIAIALVPGIGIIGVAGATALAFGGGFSEGTGALGSGGGTAGGDSASRLTHLK